jgi:hypothetical protein
MYLKPNILTRSNLAVLSDDEIYLLLKTDVAEGRITEARAYEAAAIRQIAKEAQYYIGSHTMQVVSSCFVAGNLAANPVVADTVQVKYLDKDDAEQTLAAERILKQPHDGTINISYLFDSTNVAPTLSTRQDAVRINFTAGITEVDKVDPLIKHAIMQNIAYWFDKPEAVNARFETSFDRVINNFRLCWI